MALSYDICVLILYDHPVVSFGDRLGQSLQRPCGDRRETSQSSCNLHYLVTKSHNACAMSLRDSYDYLQSLRSFFLAKMTI